MALYIAAADGPRIDHSVPGQSPESFSSSDIRAMLLLHGENCLKGECSRRAFFVALRDDRESERRVRQGREQGHRLPQEARPAGRLAGGEGKAPANVIALKRRIRDAEENGTLGTTV
ncbi:hypothetical protein ACIP5Y_24035 [Nocardia sp. NPDC088792]|uniref:hypothetical protein n=1 Tax=Nocardia sp. NPDC088792 TaxID=3364332 RepID=UPI003813C415